MFLIILNSDFGCCSPSMIQSALKILWRQCSEFASGEHIQLDIVRVASRAGKRVLVVNFVVGQRQTQTEVGVNQRLTPFAQQVDAGDRRRLMVSKQLRPLPARRRRSPSCGRAARRHRGPLRFGQG